MTRILLTLSLGLMMTACAQPYRAGVVVAAPNRAVAYPGNHFAERITRGERSGLLTRREADRLWGMERNLRREIDRAYRSGYGVSPRERERIAVMEARLDREITLQLRDGERNYRGPRRY